MMLSNMRTLGLQVQVRRLLRVHAEYAARLAAEPDQQELALAARSRLLELCRELRAAWTALGPPESLRRYVFGAAGSMEAAVALIGVPGVSLARSVAEFREAALPLLFFLRGVEAETGQPELELLEAAGLPRSA